MKKKKASQKVVILSEVEVSFSRWSLAAPPPGAEGT